MHPLIQTVLDTVRKHALLDAGDTVVVGLSGGADSVALLHCLIALRDTLELAQICAVHVHHGLRGTSADRDEAFVRSLCESLSVPLSVVHIDVRAEAALHHESLEEAGRRCRYAVFEQEASRVSQAKIATAHSASDRAETMLLNMARGCGTAGLASIPVRRDTIVRPLLYATAEEIRHFCAEQQYPYVEDETNRDTAFARNRVRLELMPVLTALNAGAVQHMTALADTAADEHAFLMRLATAEWDAAKVGENRFDAVLLSQIDPILFTYGLKQRLSDMGGHPERTHLQSVLSQLLIGGAVVIPGQVQVRSDGTVLSIALVSRHRLSEPTEQAFTPPCEVQFHDTRYRVHCLSRAEYDELSKVHKKLFNFCVSYDMIKHGACLRPRRDGDRFRPFSRGCTKSIKKWCNEQHLTLAERAAVPVLCDENGVLAILGYAVDERAAVTHETERVGWFEVMNN